MPDIKNHNPIPNNLYLLLMKKFCNAIVILTILFIFNSKSFAQTTQQETIYLKNGSIIKGNIVEFVPNATYTILTPDGNKFIFNISDIEKIAYSIPNNNPINSNSNSFNANSTTNKNSSNYATQIHAGYGASSGGLGLNSFNIMVSETGKFAEIIEIGGGIGYSRFFDVDVNMLPIFATAKFNFSKKSASPFLSVDGGYSLNLSDGIENSGIYVHPKLGFQLQKLRIAFGYQMQQMPFITSDGWSLKKQFLYGEAISINVSYSF